MATATAVTHARIDSSKNKAAASAVNLAALGCFVGNLAPERFTLRMRLSSGSVLFSGLNNRGRQNTVSVKLSKSFNGGKFVILVIFVYYVFKLYR